MSQEGPGSVIGRYKLLQQLGEGGFGVVYQAEQTDPVRRIVALKVIKLGMDTRQVIARFEAERQALALMDHPGIAKVLDAGATEGGRPYFVMELVKGIPITDYCDQARLDTAARLDLFREVCHAVQHAHQKGIIHRDLKPSNILVALHDGKPVPKIIDFGIAKATDRHLTDKTLFTEFRQMIGTPEYMAPEQAEMSGLDVDTRADIYSLGVLLYELLTGTKPHDLRTLAEKGYEEILRTIREVDPQRPSTRVSTMGEELEAVASKRHTAGTLLGRVLKGDLDWIVMKALEKDRSRRYETANALALDIQRHMEDQPVAACPPSPVYRARKYVRRHRIAVAAASAVFGMLVAGVVLSLAGYADAAERRERARASHEAAARDEAAAEAAHAGEVEQRSLAEAKEKEAESDAKRAKTVVDLVQDMLGSADPHEVKGKNYTVRQLLDDFDRDLGTRLTGDAEVEAAIRLTMGIAYRNLGLLDKAGPHLRKALAIHRERGQPGQLVTSLDQWARLKYEHGEYVEAERLWREALAVARKSLGEEHLQVVICLNNLAVVLDETGRRDEAESLAREALAIARKTLGEGHPQLALSLTLAANLETEGNADEVERLRRDAVATSRNSLGGEHPQVASHLNNLGVFLEARGRYDEAEAVHREALAIRRKSLGDEHPDVGDSLQNLAAVLEAKGSLDEAEELYGEALAIYRKSFGEEHPRVAASLHNLAAVLEAKGSLDEAERLYREALAIARRAFGEKHPRVAASLNNLALVLKSTGKTAEAERLYREALAIMRKSFGERDPQVAICLENLAVALCGRGAYDEAEGLCREALAIARESFGEKNIEVASYADSLVSVLSAKVALDDAERLCREALAIRRASLGGEHQDVARNLWRLAELQLTKEDFVALETTCRELLKLDRSHATLAPLGLCLLKQAKYAEAEPVLRECVRIREKELPDSWARWNALSMLGEALAGQGKHAEAEPLLIEGYEKMVPPDPLSFRKREALDRIVTLYEAWGKPEECAKWKTLREDPGKK